MENNIDQKVESQYLALFDNSLDGIAYMEAIYDRTGRVIDCRYIDMNTVYVSFLPVSKNDAIGKRVLEILPNTEQAWFDTFSPVVRDGKRLSFEMFHETTNRWYKVMCFRPEGNKDAFVGIFDDITQQKKAEKALKSQQEFLRTIVDNSPNLVFVKDWDGRFILVNKKMAELFGLSVEEMIGKTELEINPNIINAVKFLKDDREVMETLETKIIQEEIFEDKRTGKEYWFHTTKVPLVLSNGEARQVLVVASDITKQKQKDETIRQITDRLQLATQTANIGIWDWDLINNKLVWDDNMYSLYGITADTFSGIYEAWEMALHPEDKKREEAVLQMVLRGENEYNTEFRVLWPDNSVHYIKAVGLVQRDDKGEPIRMLGTNWDITLLAEARKEIEIKNENLEKSVHQRTLELYNIKNRLEFLQTSAPVVIYTSSIEPPYGTTYIGKNIKQTMGYEPQEFIEDPNFWASKIHPEDAPNIFEELPRLFEEEYHSHEYRCLCNNGLYSWMHDEMRIVKDENGIPTEILGYLIDITEHKKAEASLQLAKSGAENANRAKSEFLANMSHEIRTPLNAIIGFTELLNATIVEPKQKSQLQSIRSSGRSLLTLINDILDLSKIEANKLELNIGELNSVKFFNEFENIFSAILAEKQLNYILDFDDSIPSNLLLDETRLRQVLFNLIGNAIKFTHQGSIKLKISKLKGKEISHKIDLLIQVEDSGIGIVSDQKELIFDAFKQQDKLPANKYGGTGLGLSISRRLVEMMGGKISVKSEVGKGSVFEIVLNNVCVSDVPVKQAEESSFDPNLVFFKDAKVLVVDDVEDNRNLIADLFANSNVNLLNAENGQEAVSLAQKHLPDLILMDLKMPLMNGDKAIEILSKNRHTKSIPCILITASVLNIDSKNYINDMIKAYIQKPINISYLVDVMKKYLPFELLEKGKGLENAERRVIDNLSIETMNNLPTIIDQLENNHLKKWQEVLDENLIDEFEYFGKGIAEFANDNCIEGLRILGEQISVEAQNYDIEKVLKLLDSFPEVINQLKLLQNRN